MILEVPSGSDTLVSPCVPVFWSFHIYIFFLIKKWTVLEDIKVYGVLQSSW